MHILFFTDNFPPETNAPASRTYEHAREWVSSGHRVTVITCAPNFPRGEVYEGYRNRLWQSEEVDGIRVIRVWSFVSRNEGFLLRILDFQSYMLTSFLASLFVRGPDVIVGTSPQFFTVCGAWASAALKRRPFVFELRDIWPESIRAVGAVKASKLLDIFEKIELFLYRRAAVVIAVTQSFKRNLVARGIDAGKIHVVTNGIDNSRFSPREKDSALIAELCLEGCFVAGYIGTHGMAHALGTLVEAAGILAMDEATKDVRILFVGDGATRDSLVEQANQMGIRNTIFVRSVPKEQVARYWSVLDVSIIHLRRTDLFKTVIPSKMFECMGMGIPILHGVEGESAEILDQGQAGLLFEPENAEDLAEQIRKLRADPALREELSQNGQRAVLAYDRKNLAAKMLEILKSIVRKKG